MIRAVIIFSVVVLSAAQQCRHLTVCDDDIALAYSSSVRPNQAERGVRGPPGKAGPPGQKGAKGDIGLQGQKGETSHLQAFKVEVRNILQGKNLDKILHSG